MKFALTSASSAAIIIGLFGGAAWAQESAIQDAPAATVDTIQPVENVAQDSGDRIVVTGTLVGGASEDAPLPVEVFTMDDLAEQGVPTAAEFLRSLSISSEASGEADSAIAGAAAGFANVNLRGLGASRTLVLLNGKRFASSDGGAGADINTLPMMAVGRIDVLKDGASVTYGAGAVGGVINYITRTDVDGFEVSASKKLFADSDGEDSLEVLWGAQTDTGNLLLGASWGKRYELSSADRSFSTLPYQQQPAGWTVFDSNPGSYYTAATGTTALRDYTPASCQAIGGQIVRNLNSAATATSANDCAVPLPNYFNLIDEEEYLRGYMEFNADFSDTQEFHFELSYAKTTNPNINAGNSLPNGGKRATATNTFPAFPNGAFTVPYAQNLYSATGAVVGTAPVNPFAAEFFNRLNANRIASGLAPVAPGNLLTHNQWRPLMFGPNSLFEGGHRVERQERERFGGSISLSGEFTPEGLFAWVPEGTTYDYSGTYSEYTNLSQRPDWIISRLQDALNGYGGASCAAVDRVPTNYTSAAAYDASVGIQSDTAPGTNGCQYFNPFASSFANSFVNGAANPSYAGSAFENSPALLRWLTHDRRFETTNRALTIDAVFSGVIPGFELPGGEIGWAFGSQWRQTESRGTPQNEDEELNRIAQLDCPYGDQGLPATFPNQGACLAQSGPYFGSGINRQIPFFEDRQTISYFGEVQLPILENLNVQLAARREEFGEIAGNIWKVAAKYDPFDWLSFRGSYSTNFQAPPEDLGALGVEQGSVYISSLLRGLNTTINTLDGITPEDDTGQNLGVIFAPEVFGGQLRASADWWKFTIDGEIASTAVGTALQRVFGTGAPSQTTLANCSSPFVGFFEFSTGPCVQGTTNASQISNVFQYTLNTGGFDTSGIDYNVDYTYPIGPGDLIAGLSATQVLTYDVKGYGVPGVIDEYAGSFDGLGLANLGTAGTIMPEWRGNANLRYVMDEHNFGVRANYTSGFVDDTPPVRTGQGPDGVTGTADDVFATFGLDANDLWTFDLTYLWTPSFWDGLSLRASVINFTDEDPMPAQNTNAGGAPSATRTGYYPGYGDPRGRQIEFGASVRF